ncbi:MAG: hypothetical protein ACFFAO_03850 [Candidatus Hermodarchaeota archaeon]
MSKYLYTKILILLLIIVLVLYIILMLIFKSEIIITITGIITVIILMAICPICIIDSKLKKDSITREEDNLIREQISKKDEELALKRAELELEREKIKLERKKIEMLESNIDPMEQIKKILNVSNRIKLDLVRRALFMDQQSFDNKILDWANQFNFKIDGDYLVTNVETVDDFINMLDEQFVMWEESEKLKLGKKKD